MSDTKDTKTQEESNEKVASAVQERYLESFVKSAAQYGIEPTSEEDLENLLKIASRIRDIQDTQEPMAKEASANRIKEACDALYALEV